MKKIFLFISVIGLFALTSCNIKNPTDESSNSNSSIKDTSTQNESRDSSGNTSNVSKSFDETLTSTVGTKDSRETGGNVWSDDEDWGPLHQ